MHKLYQIYNRNCLFIVIEIKSEQKSSEQEEMYQLPLDDEIQADDKEINVCTDLTAGELAETNDQEVAVYFERGNNHGKLFEY